MQRSNRRAKFGWWLLLIWAAALVVVMLIHTGKPEETPRYDGATLVIAEAGWEHV